MATRLSIFRVKGIREILGEMAHEIRGEAFTNKSTAGFILEKHTVKAISARYVEKQNVSEIVEDPFGKKTSFERTYFRTLKFEINAVSSVLIVYNSSSLTKSLIGRLSEFGNFQISIEPLEIDVEGYFKRLKTDFPSARVCVASISDHKITNSTLAKITVESAEDARPHALRLLRSPRIAFSALKIEFEAFGAIRLCDVKRGGQFSLFGEDDPVVISRLISLIQA